MESSKLGRVVAKGLHIDLDYRQRHEPKDAVRSAADSFQSIELYEEREPTVKEFLLYHRPTLEGTRSYVRSLFPFLSWIFHYNWQWLLGDVVAGKLRTLCCPSFLSKIKREKREN